MIDIFGPNTARVLRLITDISDLGSEEADVVADAWRRASAEERAAAWTDIQRSERPEDRIAIQNAAQVARHQALSVGRGSGRGDWAFWSAAWDAAAAVAADGESGDAWDYRVLVSAMATRVTWLSQRRPSATIPTQRGAAEPRTVS